MPEPPRTSYDELPYESQFFTMTHPDRMAVMARLHGLTSPAVERCRVLEMGCSDGANLLPMAQTLPGSQFVGIDLSPRQVDSGRALVADLGLTNVELKAMSVLDVGDDFGRFDYIICHGVYSWVPEPVRGKILSVCARNLAPGGVAYVSYNTYPGWHFRGLVRDMLLFHTEGLTDPAERVGQARAFLDFLARAAGPADDDYARVLGREARLLDKERDTYLFHEHLEEENHPVYFREFAARAAEAGLQYLGPARFNVWDLRLDPETVKVVDRLGTDRVRREQYLDFVRNRTFRQSLLCHAGEAVHPAPRPEALGSLRLVAHARPLSETPDLGPGAPEEFEAASGERATTDRPLLKAALVALFERWPASATLDEIGAEAGTRVGQDVVDGPAFAESVLQAIRLNLVTPVTHEPRIARAPGERPLAGALARSQAAGGGLVVSLRLRNVRLNGLDAMVLRLLDGTRGRAEILSELEAMSADDTFTIEREGEPIRDPARVRALLSEELEPSLDRLVRQALLLET